MQNSPNYNFSADLIRAAAIIGVVFIHVFGELIMSPSAFVTPDFWFANLVDSALRPAVPLFILLSGFLLLDQRKTYTIQEFLKKRFYRVGIPLLLWPLFYYLWNLMINNGEFVMKHFINRSITLDIYYHLYFLYVIAGLYLIAPIIKNFLTYASQATKIYALIIAFSYSIIITAFQYNKEIHLDLSNAFTIFLPYFAYFLAGDFLRNISITKKQLLMCFCSFLAIAIVTALLNVRYMEHVGWSRTLDLSKANYDKYFYDYLSITVIPMSLLVFVMLMNVNKYINLQQKFLKKTISTVSKTSFGIYLIHPWFLDISNRYWGLGPTQYTPVWLFIIIKSILILVLSYVVVMVIQKIKGVRMIFG